MKHHDSSGVTVMSSCLPVPSLGCVCLVLSCRACCVVSLCTCNLSWFRGFHCTQVAPISYVPQWDTLMDNRDNGDTSSSLMILFSLISHQSVFTLFLSFNEGQVCGNTCSNCWSLPSFCVYVCCVTCHHDHPELWTWVVGVTGTVCVCQW